MKLILSLFFLTCVSLPATPIRYTIYVFDYPGTASNPQVVLSATSNGFITLPPARAVGQGGGITLTPGDTDVCQDYAGTTCGFAYIDQLRDAYGVYLSEISLNRVDSNGSSSYFFDGFFPTDLEHIGVFQIQDVELAVEATNGPVTVNPEPGTTGLMIVSLCFTTFLLKRRLR